MKRPEFPVATALPEAVQDLASSLALAALRSTLESGRPIYIPSLGIEIPPLPRTGPLFSSQWYSTLGSAYIRSQRRNEYSIPEIEFLLNGDISPFTRYMFWFASAQEATTEVSKLSSYDQKRVLAEITQYAQPEEEFRGRLWMRHTIQSVIAPDNLSINPK